MLLWLIQRPDACTSLSFKYSHSVSGVPDPGPRDSLLNLSLKISGQFRPKELGEVSWGFSRISRLLSNGVSCPSPGSPGPGLQTPGQTEAPRSYLIHQKSLFRSRIKNLLYNSTETGLSFGTSGFSCLGRCASRCEANPSTEPIFTQRFRKNVALSTRETGRARLITLSYRCGRLAERH